MGLADVVLGVDKKELGDLLDDFVTEKHPRHDEK
jgi:hypothetical protein